jgi:hypothetical protein
MRENAALKARRYLSEGRVVLTRVEPGRVEAYVRGDGRIYSAGFAAGLWLCDCPALSQSCCHLRALRLVTAVDLAPVGSPNWPASSAPDQVEDTSFEDRR